MPVTSPFPPPSLPLPSLTFISVVIYERERVCMYRVPSRGKRALFARLCDNVVFRALLLSSWRFRLALRKRHLRPVLCASELIKFARFPPPPPRRSLSALFLFSLKSYQFRQVTSRSRCRLVETSNQHSCAFPRTASPSRGRKSSALQLIPLSPRNAWNLIARN